MIVFNLKCRRGHEFEAWFNNTANFERLRKAGHVTCSTCGSAKVEKALTAPQISTRKGKHPAAEHDAPAVSDTTQYANDPAAAKVAALMKQVAELRTQVEKNCDYVGERFPEEARKIHYGETPKRGIYGEATDRDARDMADEGIEFSRIPWSPRRDA